MLVGKGAIPEDNDATLPPCILNFNLKTKINIMVIKTISSQNRRNLHFVSV